MWVSRDESGLDFIAPEGAILGKLDQFNMSTVKQEMLRNLVDGSEGRTWWMGVKVK